MLGRLMGKVLIDESEYAVLKRMRCQAGRDGDCEWKHCPQNRDGEPTRTGRHCPLDYPYYLEKS